jgi:hypothetical protein
VWRAPCKGGAFQWVQAPPGNRSSLWLNAAKAQLGQIKLIDKDIDRPDWIILAQIVV